MADDIGALAGAGFVAGGDLLGGLGSLIGGDISSSGYKKEAALYGQAAQLEGVNQQYQQESTAIQQIIQQRKAAKTIGAQEAAIGAAGFQESGTALSLLRESKSNAGIASGVLAIQGGINVANFQEQALGYQAQAAGAEAASKAAKTGGFLGALGGIAKAGAAILPFL